MALLPCFWCNVKKKKTGSRLSRRNSILKDSNKNNFAVILKNTWWLRVSKEKKTKHRDICSEDVWHEIETSHFSINLIWAFFIYFWLLHLVSIFHVLISVTGFFICKNYVKLTFRYSFLHLCTGFLDCSIDGILLSDDRKMSANRCFLRMENIPNVLYLLWISTGLEAIT